MKVLAAITGDAAAPVVLAGASALTELLDADVEALHVGSARAMTVAGAAREAGVELRTIPGAVVREVVEAAETQDVVAVAIGARGAPALAAGRPAGRTALALVASLAKPVVVVLPGAECRSIRSVLVPLDGTASSAAALEEIVAVALGANLEIVVAHVQWPWALPAFSDHLPHEVRAWSEEFIARHMPAARDARLELRVGEPHEHVLDICRSSGCDLVALGWSQDLGRGRAAVVRRMLAESPVPVLLTPVHVLAAATHAGASEAAGGERAERPGSLARSRVLSALR
jgi:hypothetical protein